MIQHWSRKRRVVALSRTACAFWLRATLEAIFSSPVPANIAWSDIESLFVALGCTTIEGRGSRVRFERDGVVGAFHRSHPAKEARRYQVRDACAFLTEIGEAP